MGQDSISVFFSNENKNDDNENCKAFSAQFVQISNSRLDLLHRFYSPKSELHVSENAYEVKHSIKVQAHGQQEIQYLLASLLDNVEHKFSSAVHIQKLKDHSLLFTNGVLEAKHSGARHFFTRTWMLRGKTDGFTICSETLQLYSKNATESLLTHTKLKLEHFRKDLATHYPQVIEKRIRVKVGVCTLCPGTCSVAIPSQSSCQELLPTSEKLVHSEAAMNFYEDEMRPSSGASTPEGRSTRVWSSTGLRTLTDLPKSVSPLTLNSEYPFVSKKKSPKVKDREMRLHTPLEEYPKLNSVKTENPLSPYKCLPDRPNQELETSSPPVDAHPSFLNIFAPPPEPEGAPVVWDLSHEAVSTQMRLKQEPMGDRPKLEDSGDALTPLPTDSNTVPWNERTLFLDNLPRNVHPESLRRAFEVTFGEIEEENGIILCSARRSSIAYVVFKSKLSAEAVGRSDCWIKGSKLIIQKHKDSSSSSGPQVQSLMYPSRENPFQGSSSRRSSLSSTTSDAFSMN